jgi:hypothetical protein
LNSRRRVNPTVVDYTKLDHMSFHDLNECLEYVLKQIRRVEDEIPKGQEDPRLDLLYAAANKIIQRMNSVVQQGGFSSEDRAKWNKLMPKYEQDYEKYTDTFLDDDIVLDSGE